VASKRDLESVTDWHTSLLEHFDDACTDVKYRHRPVSLSGQHASTIPNSDAIDRGLILATVVFPVAKDVVSMCPVWRKIKLKFHGTDTDTDTDFLDDPRAEVGMPRRSRPIQLADLSADFCPTRAFPREDVRWGCACVYTCTCTVHDKLSCTRLQNYTIGASLKSVSVSVSVSVPWNLSLTVERSLATQKVAGSNLGWSAFG